jgi:hypothetical protein
LCLRCDAPFKSSYSLNLHMKETNHYYEDEKSSRMFTFHCTNDKCLFVTNNFMKLNSHVKIFHQQLKCQKNGDKKLKRIKVVIRKFDLPSSYQHVSNFVQFNKIDLKEKRSTLQYLSNIATCNTKKVIRTKRKKVDFLQKFYNSLKIEFRCEKLKITQRESLERKILKLKSEPNVSSPLSFPKYE